MTKSTVAPPPPDSNNQSGFKDVYRRHQIREANPEKYFPEKPIKNGLINALIFFLSLTMAVSGLLFYGFWRDENVTRARLALAGFWINLIFLFGPLFLLFFLN